MAVLADAAVLLRRMLARLGLRRHSLPHRALHRGGEVASRLRLYVPVIHFHVDNFHEFNLCGELLNFLLKSRNRQQEKRAPLIFQICLGNCPSAHQNAP